MKIFCLGCMKTGTTTFSECMRMLGFDHQTYDYEIVRQFMAGNSKPAWQKIVQHQSFDDWPFFVMYREIADRYPDGKFFLTTRKDPETWLSSMDAHTMDMGNYVRHVHRYFFGAEYPRNNPKAFLDFYNRHNDDVRSFFGSRLVEICWEDGHGWKEVCEGLGIAAPAFSLPHMNSRKSRRTWKRRMGNLLYAELEKREIELFRKNFPAPPSFVEKLSDPRGPIAPALAAFENFDAEVEE